MWEPVGPLPASVYWRRRWVAIATTVAVIIGAVWTVSAFTTPTTGDGATERAASRAAVSAPQQASPSPSANPPTATGTERLPDTTATPTTPTPTPTPIATPIATSATVPPTGPVPCTNDMLGIVAEVAAPEHKVGDRPTFRLVVTNTSDQPCVRDLDAARQEIVVWSGDGATRLWSSNDCTNAGAVDLRTLVPGQPVAFPVQWAGRTSAPGCAEQRTTVPPGSYRLLTRLDDAVSAPATFTRLPSP